MTKTQAAILALIVLVLAGGAFFLRKGQTTTQTNTETPIQSAGDTVLYSESGFSPKTLTVKKGTTVLFKKEISFPMWVGSDPHPAHTGYPAFDQKTTGDSYSFTFTEAGSYPYHNHMNPGHAGTIIVE